MGLEPVSLKRRRCATSEQVSSGKRPRVPSLKIGGCEAVELNALAWEEAYREGLCEGFSSEGYAYGWHFKNTENLPLSCPPLVYKPSDHRTPQVSIEKGDRLFKDCTTYEELLTAVDFDPVVPETPSFEDYWQDDECCVCGLLVVNDGTGCECSISHCARDGCACHHPNSLKS